MHSRIFPLQQEMLLVSKLVFGYLWALLPSRYRFELSTYINTTKLRTIELTVVWCLDNWSVSPQIREKEKTEEEKQEEEREKEGAWATK